jgi:hypothetical protein
MTNARGIDISKYQAATPSLAGLTFLFARASIGSAPDPTYARHAADARAAGLILGAYHFGYFGNVSGQVATFLSAAPSADFYALDVEGPNAPSHAESREFLALVKGLGKRTVLYHSESGFFDAGQDYNWVANWSRTPAIPWDFWQTRGSPLDLDQYHGTAAQLRAIVHPSVHELHFAKGAEVRHWANKAGCVATSDAKTMTWKHASSHAPAGPIQPRAVCGTAKTTRVALALAGAFKGRLVRIATGVTWSAE